MYKYYNFISKYTLAITFFVLVILHEFKLAFKKKRPGGVKHKIFVLGKQLPKMSFQCVNIDTVLVCTSGQGRNRGIFYAATNLNFYRILNPACKTPPPPVLRATIQ